MYRKLKYILSAAHMLLKCSMGPFSIPNDPMKVSDPIVKLIANFCGRTAMTGKPTKNANAKNRADSPRSPQKTCRIYASDNKEHGLNPQKVSCDIDRT